MVHDHRATGVNREGLNGRCIGMWKETGKTTTLLLFRDSIFHKTETNREMLPLETKQKQNYFNPLALELDI